MLRTRSACTILPSKFAMSTSRFFCSLCSGDFVAPSETLLLNHIRLVHSCDPNFFIQCSFPECLRTFKNFRTYQNHRLKHRFHEASGESDCSFANELDEQSLGSVPRREVTAPSVPFMKSYCARWILKTRESRGLTRSATQGVIEDVQDLVTVITNSLESQALAALRASGIDPDSITGFSNIFSGPTTKPFDGLTSFYQQLQYCRNHFNLVVSLQYSLLTAIIIFCVINMLEMIFICCVFVGAQEDCSKRNSYTKALGAKEESYCEEGRNYVCTHS